MSAKKIASGWYAKLPDGDLEFVTVEYVRFEHPPDPWVYSYVTRGPGRVGVFPGTGSDEWIEVVW